MYKNLFIIVQKRKKKTIFTSEIETLWKIPHFSQMKS